MEASLYLHVPFCAGACDYCDFYSVRSRRSDPRQEAFVEKIVADLSAGLRFERIDAVPTLFIGGGTPTLLGPRLLERLLTETLALCPSRPLEVTVEANPESLDADVLAALVDGGATRVSLGMQSLHDRSRRAVCRSGSAESARRALGLVGSRFPGRFSVDLIAGLPFQDETSLLDDIRSALDAGAAHVSLYSLILEEGTPLAERAARGAGDLPDADRADELWIAARDFLEGAGVRQYEVSNFARPGEECRHNLRYWRMESWLGFGPAASGTIVDEVSGTARRATVPADVDGWLSGSAVAAEESVDATALMEETLLMGFRTTAGPDPDLFRRRFGSPLETVIGASLDSWRKRGLVRAEAAALTAEGLLFLDPFILECLAELEKKLPPNGYSK